MSCATCALSETCLGFILTVIQTVFPDVGETLLGLGQRAREGARLRARYERLSIDESRGLYYHIQFIGNYHRPFNQPVQLNRRGFWTVLTWAWQWFQCRNKINQKDRYSIIKMNAIPWYKLVTQLIRSYSADLSCTSHESATSNLETKWHKCSPGFCDILDVMLMMLMNRSGYHFFAILCHKA